MPEVLPVIDDWLAHRRPMLIGGEAVDGPETLEVEDPATGARIAEVAQGGPAQIGSAVASARVAFEGGWRWLEPSARGRLIMAVAAAVDAHREELAQLDAIDAGIPISYSRALIAAAIDALEYAAGTPARMTGEALTPSNSRGDQVQAMVLREPLGVVGLILPWNSPISATIDKTAQALATGNAVVIKAAEQTPLGALRLGELFLEAGLPPGVVNVVSGLGPSAGAALVEHPGVDKIAFTGSTATGKRIVAAAAANLTKVSLELGGKSPNVVFADADLRAAAQASVDNAFYLSGQVCTAPSRLLVERRAFDDFVSELRARTDAHVLGAPLDPSTTLGPLISRVQRDRVLGHIESGLRDGARLAHGGTPLEGQGYYVEPTVLTHTTADMAVEREEIFGPVVSVTPFDGVDEAIRMANDTSYGLAAGVWTNDLRVAQRMTRELQAGNVWINCFNLFDPALPFGGYKQSGWGRESGSGAVDSYTQTKTVATAS